MAFPNVGGHCLKSIEGLTRTKGEGILISCYAWLELRYQSSALGTPDSQVFRLSMQSTTSALWLLDFGTTPTTAFLSFQLADNRSWNFSASITVWTNFSLSRHMYLLLILFLWKILTNIPCSLYARPWWSISYYASSHAIKCYLFLLLPELFLIRKKGLWKKTSVCSDMYLNGAILKLYYYYSTQE